MKRDDTKKVAAWILALMMTGILGGCKRAEETKQLKKSTKNPTEIENTDPSDEKGSGNSSDGTTGKDPKDDTDIGKLDPDRIVFTYARTNSAWVPTNNVFVVMGDGRIYAWSNLPTTWSVKNGLDNDGMILEITDKIRKLPVMAQMDMNYLQELYIAASKVDPNASVEKKHMKSDFGQQILTYWDEEQKPFVVLNRGDTDFIIDDPNIATIEDLWENFTNHVEEKVQFDTFGFYTKKTTPMTTWNCGYVELPDEETYCVFPNYETFLKKAEEWHLDVPDMGIGDDPTMLEWPVFVKFDIFSTMGHTRDYDAIVREDEKVFLLMADSCKDPDPDQMVGEAMDGYVTVALFPMGPDQDLSGLVTEGGVPWKLITADPS